MKKYMAYVIGILILALLALPKLRTSSSEPVRGYNRSVPVRIHVATESTVYNEIQIPGTILPNEHIQITSEIAGIVKEIYFQEGKSVKKGSLLLKLDDAVLQAQKAKILVQLDLATQRQERGEQQLAINAISQEEYDVLANTVETLQAELKLLDVQISKTLIRAPFDGVIGLRQTSPGSYIVPNTLISLLLDIDPVKVEFAVPGKYAGMIQKKNSITFTPQGQEQEFSGEVYALEPQIDPSTRTIKVRAKSSNPDGMIVPGAFATINLILETLPQTIMIPSEALIPDLSSSKVYLVKNGKAQLIPVESGLRFEENVQIISGIAQGDTVVTSGLLNLRPNATVTIEPRDVDAEGSEDQTGMKS